MRLNEIGQQLRAYRLESGMRAEEIAARLGVSRAALYRYEKGEVIKLDTVQRLAELLKISPLSLLGIGVEYYSRTIGFFERLRQLEESAEQILQVGPLLCHPVTSDAYESALRAALFEAASQAGDDAVAMRTLAEQVLGLLATRRRTYRERRPNVIAILPEPFIRTLLTEGICAGVPLGDAMRRHCREVAALEVESLARVLETEPMGQQFSVLPGSVLTTSCIVMRQRDRATLALNPFPGDSRTGDPGGVALVTAAPEAVASHQRVAESVWRESVKGHAAAERLRSLLAAHRIR
jgi:transcriptional regulator with XRE-family HTH domain